MTEDETILGRAIAKIEDENLRATVEREVALLRGSRKFGLVFDRHLPESVRLIGHPIRPGVKVALRDESSADEWRVVGFADRSRQSVLLDDESTRPVDELVVVREFGEPIHPGLEPVERIQRADDDAPWHTVINGENFHALQLLRETHRGQVDLIYIDPPYNTGNDGWIYNDKFVLDADRAKSSKWLSFMERRLAIARDLLKPTGVIIVAIGDDEHHRLRMLMDQVFGVGNFVGNLVWQGGGSFFARHHAGGVDYMLVYGRDAEAVPGFHDVKPMAPEMLALVADRLAAGSTPADAQRELRAFIRANRDAIASGLAGFNSVDPEGRVFDTADITNRMYRPNLKYPITDPETGIEYQPPENGWTLERTVVDRMLADGLVVFGGRFPRGKKLLSKYLTEMPIPTFTSFRSRATAHLNGLLGESRFPNPKDHEVLIRWFRMTAPKDALVLDFFVGSGSAAEAVIQLNAEDGGTRQSIVVTNSEVGSNTARALRRDGHHPGDPEWEEKGVFEYVTRPRISTVVTGARPDGSEYSEGLEANVEFLKLTYLDPGAVRRGQEFVSVAPILWLESGARGERIDGDPGTGWALTDTYGVLFDVDAINPFVQAAEEREPDRVYVVSDSPAQVRAVAERLPSSVETVALYDDYLRRFEGNRDT